jgi:hypothetical protein
MKIEEYLLVLNMKHISIINNKYTLNSLFLRKGDSLKIIYTVRV